MSSEPKDDRTNPFGTTGPWGTAYRGPVPLTPPPSSQFSKRYGPPSAAPVTPPKPEPVQADLTRPARTSVISGSALPIGWARPVAAEPQPAPAPEPQPAPIAEAAPAVELASADADALLFDEPALRTAQPIEPPVEPSQAAPRVEDNVPLATPVLSRAERQEPAKPQAPEAALSFSAPPRQRRRRQNKAGAVLFVAGGGIAAAAAIAVVIGMSERASRSTAPAGVEDAPVIADVPAATVEAPPLAEAPPPAPVVRPAPVQPAPPTRAAVATAPTLRPAPAPAPARVAATRPAAESPRRVAEARPAARPQPAAAPARIQVSPQPLRPPPVAVPAPAAPPPADPLLDSETPITTMPPGD